MFQMIRHPVSIVAFLAVFALAACGGGGGAALTPGAPGAPGAPGVPGVTPVADTFQGAGNVTVSVPAPGVLVNDPAGSTVADPGTRATSLGGSVTIAADGGFTYTPPAGQTGVSDTFTYTVAGFAPVTVTITLAGRVVFVNNANPGGDGTQANPFGTLAAAETASAAGDTIFVFAGAGTDVGQDNGITLKTGQKLIGEGVGLTFGVGVVVPAGTAPLISNAAIGAGLNIPVVMLSTGNEVAGFAINAAFSDGVLAPAGTGHSIHNNTLTFDAQNGREGVRLLAVTGTNSVMNNTITGSLRSGIKFANNEDVAGNVVAPAIINASVTMSGNTINGSERDGIRINLDGTGTAVSLVIDNNAIAASTNGGIDIDVLGAAGISASVSGNDVSQSGAAFDFDASTAAGGAGTVCLELANNSNVANNSTFQVQNNGTGTFTFFEIGNDAAAALVPNPAAFTIVPQGTCGI
ncbi:MAG: Ig-like domain-containing protein [Thermodesulfobacteriota bacterium]